MAMDSLTPQRTSSASILAMNNVTQSTWALPVPWRCTTWHHSTLDATSCARAEPFPIALALESIQLPCSAQVSTSLTLSGLLLDTDVHEQSVWNSLLGQSRSTMLGYSKLHSIA